MDFNREDDTNMNAFEPSAHIVMKSQDGVMHIVMDRPDKKNALTIAMYSALTDAIDRAEKDESIRAILISGSGGYFTSGNDLKDFVESPPDNKNSPVFTFMNAISRAEKPIVAAVSGLAVGIGTTMLLHCDLVYAGASAKFLLPFVNLGLTPEAGSSFLLPLLVGYRRASELLLLGEAFSAEKALEIGLVNAVCDDSAVLDLAFEQARKLVAKPRSSVHLTKAMLKKANAQIVGKTISEEAEILMERLDSPEAAEAFKAFFEHRKPDFSRFK
jgi:enoyl-CoA hydratase/carnithine racemase